MPALPQAIDDLADGLERGIRRCAENQQRIGACCRQPAAGSTRLDGGRQRPWQRGRGRHFRGGDRLVPLCGLGDGDESLGVVRCVPRGRLAERDRCQIALGRRVDGRLALLARIERECPGSGGRCKQDGHDLPQRGARPRCGGSRRRSRMGLVGEIHGSHRDDLVAGGGRSGR